jgi:GNAT superfamily N-acetyltransferase
VSRYGPVDPLGPDHDRSTFDCGPNDQTIWLRQYGLLAQQADTARVFVTRRQGEAHVVGYYALSAGSIEPEEAPARVAAGTGRYPIPVVVLARLGVDVSEQGRGLGTALLRDAFLQVAAVAARVGVRALMIHAGSPEAAAFYLRHDPAFVTVPNHPLHLCLLMKDVRKAIRQLPPRASADEPRISDG